MTHATSPLGIVGLGALGRALETLIKPLGFTVPPAVLFTVKAFDLRTALTEQSALWPTHTPFVVMCNGYVWPVIESLYPILKTRPIRLGMTTIGSTIKPDGNIEIFAANTVTAWGNWGPSGVPVVESELQMLKAFPDGQWYNDIRPMIRQKWIFNVVINTLTGAHQLKSNGLLVHFKDDVEKLFDEALQLANILWQDLPWEITTDDLNSKLWALVKATSGNENSMARDIRLKRKTEIDFLAGIALDYEGYPRMKTYYEQISKRK